MQMKQFKKAVPLQSKTLGIIPRPATALHIFNHTMVELLAGVPSTPPDSNKQVNVDKSASLGQCSHRAAALQDFRKKNWNGALKPRRCAH